MPDVVDRAVIFDFDRPKFLSEVRHDLGVGDRRAVARRMLYLAEPSLKSVLGDSSGEAARPRQGRRRRVARLRARFGRGAVVSHAVVEALYEVASLERLVAFYVLFHAMAERVSRVSRFFFYLRFDTWRSQAGTRVATTPSPTSPAAAVDVATGLMDDVRLRSSLPPPSATRCSARGTAAPCSTSAAAATAPRGTSWTGRGARV